MQVNTERIDKKQVEITIEVEEKRFEEALQHAYKKNVGKMNIPGFRKGKVPRKILEQRFGVEILFEDAVDFIMPKAYIEALDTLEEGIEPVGKPEIDIVQLEANKPFIFKAKVEIKPEVELGEYKNIELEKIDSVVTEEGIAEELENLRQRHAQLEVLPEGTGVEKGDKVVIDFCGKKGDIPFDGGTAEDYSLDIGSGSFIPGFEEQVIGMILGEEKTISVTFPEEYHSEELAGQQVTFDIKLKEIKRKKIAELDDEFAKDVSEFETLQELKQDVENRLKSKKEEAAKAQLRQQAVEKASANTDVDIPQAMVDSQIDNILQDFEYRLKMQGLSFENYLQYSNETIDSIREKYQTDAQKSVKEQLVLEAVAKKENLVVEETDLEEEFARLSALYKQEPEKVKELLEKQGQMEAVKHSIIIDKAIQLIIDNANIS
ncbi:MAG: trigger factor [Clostridiaceae bacterium BRH_c20a]|nr:MAG: trigger factor [Clostridiaceae bacterium BRH_c20a]